MTNSIKEDAVMIPRWFIRFITATATLLVACILAGIPWAWGLSTNVSMMSKEVQSLSAVENLIHHHLEDPGIHHSGYRILNQQIEDMKRRLNKVESPK